MNKKNLYQYIPVVENGCELFEKILHNKDFIVERICSNNIDDKLNPSVWYDQSSEELVFLLKGRGNLLFYDDNSIVEMLEGDYIVIPPHCKHKVLNTTKDCIWLAIHYNYQKNE